MAYTSEEKATMYGEAHTDLTKVALSLKLFAEDKDQFTKNEPTAEQQDARRAYQQLTEMIGRFAIEAKANEGVS